MRRCDIEGCGNKHYARGWCNTHYARWKQHGNPYRERPVILCSIDNCSNKNFGYDLCAKHYARWRQWGDPNTVGHGVWLGDSVSYGGAHRRIYRKRGQASSHPCSHCDDQAKHWALIHGRGYLQQDWYNSLVAYSGDPDDYMPLCVMCHATYDSSRQLATSIDVVLSPITLES